MYYLNQHLKCKNGKAPVKKTFGLETFLSSAAFCKPSLLHALHCFSFAPWSSFSFCCWIGVSGPNLQKELSISFYFWFCFFLTASFCPLNNTCHRHVCFLTPYWYFLILFFNIVFLVFTNPFILWHKWGSWIPLTKQMQTNYFFSLPGGILKNYVLTLVNYVEFCRVLNTSTFNWRYGTKLVCKGLTLEVFESHLVVNV